jgi:hypothetical protein
MAKVISKYYGEQAKNARARAHKNYMRQFILLTHTHTITGETDFSIEYIPNGNSGTGQKVKPTSTPKGEAAYTAHFTDLKYKITSSEVCNGSGKAGSAPYKTQEK